MYYAHSTGGDVTRWQRLSDHLNNAARLAEKLGERLGIGQYARLAALLHDIGKYSQEFQQHLLGDKHRVDHSTAGAQEVLRLLQGTPAGKVVGSLLFYCIAGHHSGG